MPQYTYKELKTTFDKDNRKTYEEYNNDPTVMKRTISWNSDTRNKINQEFYKICKSERLDMSLYTYSCFQILTDFAFRREMFIVKIIGATT